MCIAIAQPKGVRIPLDVLERAARNNPDGAGYAYVNEFNKVVIVKAADFKDIREQLILDLDKYGKSSNFVIHFRIATHGDICFGNSHPFELAGNGAMIHNGILHIEGLPKNYSDSKYFANNVISKLPRNWYRTAHWPDYLTDIIGAANKVVCLYPDKMIILGEKRGQWKEGAWFSNNSGHVAFARVVTKNHPVDSCDIEPYSSGWSYNPDYKVYSPARSQFNPPTDDDDFTDLDVQTEWEETVYSMSPEERRKMVKELMGGTDISHMDDDDIEDFMTSLPIFSIGENDDPVELMKDAMLLMV